MTGEDHMNSSQSMCQISENQDTEFLDEEDIPLSICSIDEIKDHEKKSKLRAKAFVRKYASIIK